MSESLSVTVLVPVFNGARYLGEALASALAQTEAAEAVLVVDDGSTDDSVEIARSFAGVQVEQRPHAGKSAALNAGIAAVTTDTYDDAGRISGIGASRYHQDHKGRNLTIE